MTAKAQKLGFGRDIKNRMAEGWPFYLLGFGLIYDQTLTRIVLVLVGFLCGILGLKSCSINPISRFKWFDKWRKECSSFHFFTQKKLLKNFRNMVSVFLICTLYLNSLSRLRGVGFMICNCINIPFLTR